MSNANSKRIPYLDLLRIIASFAVVIIHVASQYLNQIDAGSWQWRVFRTYRDLASFAVPVFVMISGTLFLSKDISVETIIKKYITRIMIVFLFWSSLYSVVFFHSDGILTMIGNVIRGYSHMWFLYMIAGLYLVTPILRSIVKNEQLLKYFIALGILFGCMLSDFVGGVELFSPRAGDYLNSAFGYVGISICTGHVLYYALGYYFNDIGISKRSENLIIICGFAIAILQSVLFLLDIRLNGNYVGDIIYTSSCTGLLKTSAIFLVVKRFNDKLLGINNSVISAMGQLSLGAYLIHQMIITLLNRCFGINTLMMEPLLSVPLIGVFVFAISYLLIFLLRKITFVRKYLT